MEIPLSDVTVDEASAAADGGDEAETAGAVTGGVTDDPSELTAVSVGAGAREQADGPRTASPMRSHRKIERTESPRQRLIAFVPAVSSFALLERSITPSLKWPAIGGPRVRDAEVELMTRDGVGTVPPLAIAETGRRSEHAVRRCCVWEHVFEAIPEALLRGSDLFRASAAYCRVPSGGAEPCGDET